MKNEPPVLQLSSMFGFQASAFWNPEGTHALGSYRYFAFKSLIYLVGAQGFEPWTR